MQKGCLDADMSERLAEVVKAVMETGKQGTVSCSSRFSCARPEAAIKSRSPQ
ncbi:hypothetical protein MBH78_18935 [Oceanimonas sp. NS1]|nr:hypothetical protein [Oceanimonas sp. NS1]